MKRKVIIMGAAGRDFHNFLVYFKARADHDVVAFADTNRSTNATARSTVSSDAFPSNFAPLSADHGIFTHLHPNFSKILLFILVGPVSRMTFSCPSPTVRSPAMRSPIMR